MPQLVRQPHMSRSFRELTYTMRPQDPHGDGTGLRFETGEHGGDYPDNMAPGDHRDRRPGPVGRVRATTGQWKDRGAANGSLTRRRQLIPR
jgi:hypothetical protein